MKRNVWIVQQGKITTLLKEYAEFALKVKATTIVNISAYDYENGFGIIYIHMKIRKIYIGSDHAGYTLKEFTKNYINQKYNQV